MIGKILFSAWLMCVMAVSPASAQKADKKGRNRPASGSHTNIIPGYFIVDFAFNRGLNDPDLFEEDFWGSRTVNVYYNYPIRFGKSKFSLVPGVGLSLERFKLRNNHTLSPTNSAENTRELVSVGDAYSYTGVVKSMIITNYVDFPIGFRFDTAPDALYSSFFAVVGMRVGVLYESFSKIKYRENDEFKIAKHKERYGLNIFRYGVYVRLGIAGFNLFCVYNFSPYFEEGRGPGKTNMNTITAGISLGNL